MTARKDWMIGGAIIAAAVNRAENELHTAPHPRLSLTLVWIAAVVIVGGAFLLAVSTPYASATMSLKSAISQASPVAARGSVQLRGSASVSELQSVTASCSPLRSDSGSVADINACAKLVLAATAVVQHELDGRKG